MAENHEIIIDNFTPDEIVYYPIIIIKGHVKNKTKSSCQAVRIFINSGSTNCAFSIIDNKFKGLAELKLGRNIIVFKYCCFETIIPVNYIPRQTKYSVLPLYIICEGHDGKFQAPETHSNDIESACRRINLCAKLLQTVFAEKLREEKHGRKTFKLEGDCRVFYSKLNVLEARELSQEELWSRLGREIINSEIGLEETKYLGFLSCTKYCGDNYKDTFLYEDIVKLTKAYVALGGGGLALFGTACLYTWPESLFQVIGNFENNSPVDRERFMDDSNYRGTIGSCFSTTLGSVLHELCHAFDLGHTERGIMGRGFDDIYKVFTSWKSAPTSNIHTTMRCSIEFEEKFDSGLLSKPMKKGFLIKNLHSKEEDNTFWTKSCLIFLAYHKWFNNFENFKNRMIKYDPVSRVVSSLSGLRVLELRDEKDGMVLKFWIFDGRILKYSLQIPEDEIKKLERDTLTLIVEDNIGNILRCIVVVNN